MLKMMRHFTEDDVRRLLPMPDAIGALGPALLDLAAGTAINQPRRRMYLPTGAVLHALAGGFGSYFGTKIYSTHPKHGAWFTFLLYDAATGRPLAQFEANYLGQIRTGAASGLATDLIAPKQEVDVAVIGSGFQARSQVEAVVAVRKIRTLKIWSRTDEKRQKFATEMKESLGVPAVAVASSSAATRGAHIVITATYSKDPVLDAAAVRDDALILAMGSNDAKRRELPTELVRRAAIVVDDIEAARVEAGDLLLALSDEEWSSVIPLADIVSGKSKAGQNGQLVVFKSVGLGLEDVAVAALVYERSYS